MLKKSISYEDYNGVQRTEDFYFNLSKAEIAEMELSVNGGLSTMLQKIVATQNNTELMAIFKKLLLAAIGEKSLDGKRFVKNKEITDAFEQSEAYSELFFELMDANKMADFITSILPKDLAEKTKQFKGQTLEQLNAGK